LTPAIIREISFVVTSSTIYNTVKKKLLEAKIVYDFQKQALNGMISGLTAAIITSPIDVTRA